MTLTCIEEIHSFGGINYSKPFKFKHVWFTNCNILLHKYFKICISWIHDFKYRTPKHQMRVSQNIIIKYNIVKLYVSISILLIYYHVKDVNIYGANNILEVADIALLTNSIIFYSSWLSSLLSMTVNDFYLLFLVSFTACIM